MPIIANSAINPRIKANRRDVEISDPTEAAVVGFTGFFAVAVVAVVAVVDVAVAVVGAVAGAADIFYQRQGYIPRWLLPGMF
jgi:hypothetical protein